MNKRFASGCQQAFQSSFLLARRRGSTFLSLLKTSSHSSANTSVLRRSHSPNWTQPVRRNWHHAWDLLRTQVCKRARAITSQLRNYAEWETALTPSVCAWLAMYNRARSNAPAHEWNLSL